MAGIRQIVIKADFPLVFYEGISSLVLSAIGVKMSLKIW
jgi:hypothetical protein